MVPGKLNLSAVSSYTNSGSAGGTFYYIDVGGLKLLWGTTSHPGNTTSTKYSLGVTFPSGFFSATPTTTVAGLNQSGTNQLVAQVGTASSSSMTINEVHFNATSSGQQTNVICIGA